MADKKNPGIIINFDSESGRLKLQDASAVTVICSESAQNEISLQISFKIKLPGLLRQAPFDPNTIDPVGENHLYIPFDNAGEQSINYFGVNGVIDVIDPDPGNAPANLKIGFANTGKTRWGKKRWGENFNLDKLM